MDVSLFPVPQNNTTGTAFGTPTQVVRRPVPPLGGINQGRCARKYPLPLLIVKRENLGEIRFIAYRSQLPILFCWCRSNLRFDRKTGYDEVVSAPGILRQQSVEVS